MAAVVAGRSHTADGEVVLEMAIQQLGCGVLWVKHGHDGGKTGAA